MPDTPTRYRKKPVVIEAWHFAKDRMDAKPPWLVSAINAGALWFQGGNEPYYTIHTSEGKMRASVGDWIIRGVKGELYPVKNDIFQQTYEAVDAT